MNSAPQTLFKFLLSTSILVSISIMGCSVPAADTTAKEGDSTRTTPTQLRLRALKSHTLDNLLWVAERIYSGGEPQGADSFAELVQLGVKTIVSVDGAQPDVEGAKAYGLRYVHIPIGYDGIGTEAGLAVARLVRDADGPFYIHCHHGRHRGPALAAVVCIVAGEAENAEARKILEVAGTGVGYAGLWRAVESYRRPSPETKLPALVEVAKVDSFAAAMVLVDRAYDRLKLCRDLDWTTPSDHPDLAPSQEALLLREGFREAGRTLDPGAARELRTWLAESEELARRLQTSLEAGGSESASADFESLGQSCKHCHATYRD